MRAEELRACLPSTEALLSELGMSRPEEIDVDAIASHLGVSVVCEPLRWIDAVLHVDGGRAVISVNASKPEGRRRFSIAEKVGHWLLDGGTAPCDRCEGKPHGKRGGAAAESRANIFAADLLMPRSMFGPLCAGRRPSLALARELAGRFRTSVMATALRIVNLADHACVLICSKDGRRLWTWSARHLPLGMFPRAPGRETIEPHVGKGPREVPAARWFDASGADGHRLTEDHDLDEGFLLTLLAAQP